MAKILGIDTGTNSLGWAIVTKEENGEYKLHEHGTNIFTEGVKIEKGKESSKAAERSQFRHLRIQYWRRKTRKIRLLAILSDNALCPPLTRQELRDWRTKKIYPKENEAFMDWQRTDEDRNENPYHFRNLCLTQKLDLSDPTQRYILGRALYHINQRRGFLSNRKESTEESEDGKVKAGISDLTEEMKAANCQYLGEYFYKLYQEGKKIRNHYTARNEHYLAEFQAICKKQQLDDNLAKEIEKAIFFQRPLKSQKQLVGNCTFEKKKPRCPLSHPLYEDFRMYSFINNIKIQTPNDLAERPLTKEEKEKIIPLFMRKSKKNFKFEEIAKKLAGKNNYCYKNDEAEKPYKFNYQMDSNVSGSQVNAQLSDVFGDDWLDSVCEVYTLAEGKSRTQILNDIWHVLFSYDSEEHLKDFAMKRLQLDDNEAEKFSKIKVPQDYASLSLNAIKKILPYMKDYGLIYSEAVFLANLREILPSYIWDNVDMREAVIEGAIDIMHRDYPREENITKEQRVKMFLKERYFVDDEALKKMYHPSMLDVYPRQRPGEDGIYQLGNPRISSVRNPMAMRSMFRIRSVVNQLLKEEKIDEETIVHIELSRDLNDANRRKAIQADQRRNEKERAECREQLESLFKESGIKGEPTDTDILKYQLWEEQGHICIYTGKTISLTDVFGANPKYDIEHTIPRSAGGDSTKMNLTLCDSEYNRNVKKTKLPSELPIHEEIMERLKPWKEKYESLSRQIRAKKGLYFSTKEAKDSNIQRRHELQLQYDYWRGKYNRFLMTEVPEGFARRQGTDNSIISRYARLYLKSVFKQVYIVKGIATSDFRKLWGLQEDYTKKERVNHVHHCIDAVTIACIGLDEYSKLAQYYHDVDYSRGSKPHFQKPWPTFVEDMKRLQDDLLVAHYDKDNMSRKAKRRIITNQGKTIARGDAARGKLHLETYYGAIQRQEGVRIVVRKKLADMKESDLNNIVDDAVRDRIKNAIAIHGSLAKAVAEGIWMNEDKHIPINKVRCFTSNKLENLLHIRKQRDCSRYEYKQTYHVANDSNYMLAIYEGTDSKGRIKREFEEVKTLDAARYYRESNKSQASQYGIVPDKSTSGYPLLYRLKVGMMVLLYETSPEEVWELDGKGLQARLYKITGMSLADGRMMLLHQQEARPISEIKFRDGAYKRKDEFRAKMRISMSQFKALVEGVDFKLTDLGEIIRLK